MQRDDDFDSAMMQLGVEPIGKHGKPSKPSNPTVPTGRDGRSRAHRADGHDQVDRQRPQSTARAATDRGVSPMELADLAELKTELKRLQAIELGHQELRVTVSSLQADLATKSAEIQRLRDETADQQQRLAEAKTTHEVLDAERRGLQRKLSARAPEPHKPRSAEDVLIRRGLRTTDEQAEALVGLAASHAAELIAALPLTDGSALTTLLHDRVVLASADAPKALVGNAVVVHVPGDRGELGGDAAMAAAWRRFATGCARGEVNLVVIVGGSPAYRRQLRSLHEDSGVGPELRLISGTDRRPRHRAEADVRNSDLVLIWGATELDHSVSAPYTEARMPHVVAIAHRGITGMLDQAAVCAERKRQKQK